MHREIVALRYALWDYYELATRLYTPDSKGERILSLQGGGFNIVQISFEVNLVAM